MESSAAPADVPRKRISGRPRVAVRSNYGGLPSMAGRGAEEGRRKPPGSGRAEGPSSAPGSTAPKPKIAASGAPGGETHRSQGACRASSARLCLVRLPGAPLPLFIWGSQRLSPAQAGRRRRARAANNRAGGAWASPFLRRRGEKVPDVSFGKKQPARWDLPPRKGRKILVFARRYFVVDAPQPMDLPPRRITLVAVSTFNRGVSCNVLVLHLHFLPPLP